MASAPILTALLALRLAGPGILLILVLSLTSLRPTHDHDTSPIVSVIVSTKTPRRALILSFLSFIAATYFLDGALVVARAILTGVWEGSSPLWRFIEFADILGLVAFAGLAALGTWKDVNGIEIWTRFRIKACGLFAIAVDIVQVALLALSVNLFKEPPSKAPASPPSGRLNIPNTLHFILILLRVLFLVVYVSTVYFPRVSYVPAARDTAREDAVNDNATLLVPATGTQYGTFTPSPQTPFNITRTHTPTPSDGAASTNPQVNPLPGAAPTLLKPNPRKEVSEEPTWNELRQRLGKLAPYLWPKKDRGLQILAIMCILLLIIGRIVNFLLPFTLGNLVYLFEKRVDPKTSTSPWPSLIFYVVLRFLQSPGGLPALRDTLWAPVMQYSDREMSQLSFDHLLNLSLAFHTRRKTGEILRILDRGAAINHILELLLFNIAPTFFDILIALVIFYFVFDWTVALVILLVMVAYVWASVVLTKWRTKIRRRMNDRDVITRGIHTDCLLNYETVKYFGGEQHEGRRYQDAIREYQTLEYRVMVSLNLLNLVQNLIFSLGILVGSLIVASQITHGMKDGSDFVMFITYLAQLYSPLNSLGYIYRSVNQNLVDTERLIKLLDEPTEVNDKPGAQELHVESGEIEFQNVNFSYDGRTTALNGVSFKVPKNSSVALVGESGSGKSTVLQLLYRFYDLKEGEGHILIDGHDIRDVTQSSLRKAIGVVPQDSVLFNSSIGYNIGYGKFGATHDEIEAAAKAAQMHERILSFPDGYETKVGERGVRLSGGEKQRVAIARTLLKNPPILLLDEATSALDTSTEKDIQKALQNLVKGRSSLSIAHRLSTIATADLILVLKEGQVVESGTFRELLVQNGIFASMWADQVSADDELIDPSSMQKEVASGYNVAEQDLKPETVAEILQVQPTYVSPEPQNPFANPTSIVDLSDDFIPTESPRGEEASLEQLKDDTHMEEQQSGEGDSSSHVDAAASTFVPSAAENAPGPTVFSSSDPVVPAPVGFPSAQVGFPSTPSQSDTATSPLGVTFSANVDSPPSRSGTPDPEGMPKRIRKTSQNIQKFARSLSLGRRHSSASSVPKLETGSPRTSREDSHGEGSVGGESTEAEDAKGGKDGKGKGKKIKRLRSSR